MFTPRIQLQLIIGSDAITQGPLDKVCTKLAEKYGGLTRISCEGQWAIDGDAFVEAYGRIATEAAYIILLSMVPEALDMAYIQKACAPLQGMANWIHVEMKETMAAHFSLDKLTVATN